MSKAKLKKHLLSLTKEQITDIVLELYDARKEAKDYPEFYLAPDCNAELEKMQTNASNKVSSNLPLFIMDGFEVSLERARKLSETSSSQLVDFPKSRHLPNVEKSFPIFKS